MSQNTPVWGAGLAGHAACSRGLSTRSSFQGYLVARGEGWENDGPRYWWWTASARLRWLFTASCTKATIASTSCWRPRPKWPATSCATRASMCWSPTLICPAASIWCAGPLSNSPRSSTSSRPPMTSKNWRKASPAWDVCGCCASRASPGRSSRSCTRRSILSSDFPGACPPCRQPTSSRCSA